MQKGGRETMRLSEFRITNYRNIIDSGWIKVNNVTAIVGQNEAGKSNLFEALYCLHSYVETQYNPDEDWPVDDWKGKKNADGKPVAQAVFEFEEGDAKALFQFAAELATDNEGSESEALTVAPPDGLRLFACRGYRQKLAIGFATRRLTRSPQRVLDYPKSKYRNGRMRTFRASYSFKTMSFLAHRSSSMI